MERRERASVTMGAPRWRLPRVGLGTGLHGGVSERQSVTTIEHALECGVRFFDTALSGGVIGGFDYDVRGASASRSGRHGHPLDDVHHRLTIPTS